MKYLTPLDLNQNEIQNVVLQNLGSDPGSPVEGQMWYNTTSHRPMIRLNGSTLDLSDALKLGGNAAAYYIARANHTGTQLAATISDFNTAVRTNTLNQLATPTADVALGGFKLTGVATPTAGTDAPNKTYVDNLINGTKWLAPVICATTANITLSGEQTLDGVTTNASRVLVKDQSTASQNGIYLSSSGAWTRVSDFAAGANAANASLFVEQGTTYADTQWICSTNTGSAVVGTNSLTFVQFGSGSSYTADESTLHLTGTVFSIKSTYPGQASITTLGTVTTGVWQGTEVAVNKGGTGSTSATGARSNLGAVGKYSALIGDGSNASISITQATHGLAVDGTNMVSIYDASTGAQVMADVTVAPGTGTVTIVFTTAPASNAYRVVIIG
jgi:hypothetical protein